MKMQSYPEFIDCIWVASDSQGNVGAFITAGMGPIPVAVLNQDHLPVEAIEEVLCQLPAISKANLLVHVVRPDSFIAIAERGFFVFDWFDIHRTNQQARNVYEAMAVPSRPISVESLPVSLGALARALVLPSVLFASSSTVDVRAVVRCVEPGSNDVREAGDQ